MASVDSMPLIYENNRGFLKGKRRKLFQSREALDSLAASLGIPASNVSSGCAPVVSKSIMMISVGIVCTALGTYMLSMVATGLDSILRTHSMSLDVAAVVISLLAVNMFVLIIGHHSFVQAFYARRYPVYIDWLYKQLIAQGEIVEGTIIDIKQGPPQLIRYRFDVATKWDS